MTSQELLDMGVKPGPLFKQLLACSTKEEVRAILDAQPKVEKKDKVERNEWWRDIQPSCWEELCSNPIFHGMFSTERPQIASNSEKRRWLEQRAVRINGIFPGPEDMWPFEVTDLVFFSNGKRCCTMV